MKILTRKLPKEEYAVFDYERAIYLYAGDSLEEARRIMAIEALNKVLFDGHEIIDGSDDDAARMFNGRFEYEILVVKIERQLAN